MKVLVTGASGYIGGSVATALRGAPGHRAIGRMPGLGERTEPMTPAEAAAEWGEGAANYTMGSNSRVRAVRARRELGWAPHRPPLLRDIERGSYQEAS